MIAKANWQFLAWFLVFLLASTSVVIAQSELPQSDIDPASDLRTVIILAGYPCISVVEYSQSNDTAYHVSCDVDQHYLVHVTEDEEVIVRRRSDPAVLASQDAMSHDDLMKKHLLSVVNLAGYECAGLSSYERHGSNGHTVTCEDQTVYRIHVTPEGRVAVDKHPLKK